MLRPNRTGSGAAAIPGGGYEHTSPYGAMYVGSYTVEDWEALPDDVRAELIDGVLIYMESPVTSHQIIVSQVLYSLRDFSREHHGGCLPLCSPIGVQLDQDDRTMVQPDILVVCDRTRITRKVIFGAPDLVIEVLSPSTRNYDTGLKLKKYWMAGVREYWTIDYDDNEITVYHFESGNKPKVYTFADTVPVGISGGELSIDFSRIAADIEMYLGE